MSDSLLKLLDMRVLGPNGFSAHDLDLLGEAPSKLRYPNLMVEKMLSNPLQSGLYVEQIRKSLLSPSMNAQSHFISPESLWSLVDQPLGRLAANKKHDIVAKMALAQSFLKDFVGSLSSEEAEILLRKSASLFKLSPEDTTLNPIELEERRLADEVLSNQVYTLAGKLRFDQLALASQSAQELQERLIDSLVAGRYGYAIRLFKALGQAGFPVHINGAEENKHLLGPGLWIDLEGDDEYRIPPGWRPGELTLLIDLKGNDRYIFEDTTGSTPGNMGIFLLADLAGDDEYRSHDFGPASARFGYSYLYDRSGNDQYWSRCASQGFAFFGIGVLHDESGEDTYSASLLSQGASSTKGLGLLLDEGGHDRYLARPEFVDDLRYRDHHIHMMQGFSSGQLPDYGGGLGILWDRGGSDMYQADIFGQGCGYWHGLGLLLDDQGNDKYLAHQYAQGVGVHQAVGILLDAQGDDRYTSKGVSQGCGHDLGFGFLGDAKGQDVYIATDMSQGAGSANGFGALLDAAGDDAYVALNPNMSLGHADMRRDRPSIGAYLDAGGIDQRPKGFAEGAYWNVFGDSLVDKKASKGFGLGRDQ